jgi:osmotically-inducible protein OsmY
MKRQGWIVQGAVFLLTIGTAAIASAQAAPGAGDPRQQAAQIVARIQKAPDLRDNTISVVIDNGVVRLSGTVDSPAEKAEAARLAMVTGVVGVDNRLEVGGPRALEQNVGDMAVTADIKEKMAASQTKDFGRVAVSTAGRVVTLTGSVPNEKAEKQVVEIARGTDGVIRVDNKLSVVPPML